ncbi:MAG: acetoacetate decarboxylase family protein [Candidatus Geothermincolia bacterium]
MDDNFFSGVEQVEASMAGRKVKMPVFYRDARAFTLVLPASLMALRRIMPDRRYVPAQILPGVGAVHLTAFEYFDTDIDPYNEFAIGVLLNSRQFLQIPGYNMLRQLLQNSFCTYIHHLPVNSELALRGGIEIYNYPKFMASIDFEETEDRLTCELAAEGELICRVRGKKIPAKMSAVQKFFCNLYQFDQPQGAEFKVNAKKFGMAIGPGNAELVVGPAHPVGRELRSLLLSTTPLMYIYQPSIQAILYGPEHLSLAGISMFLERGYGISLDELSTLLEREKAGAREPAAKKPAKKAAGKRAAKAAGRPAAKKKS